MNEILCLASVQFQMPLMYEFKCVKKHEHCILYVYIAQRCNNKSHKIYFYKSFTYIYISSPARWKRHQKTDAENIVIKVGWKMQQHGSLKSYNPLSKVKMLVVSQKYHLTIRKPTKKSAHFKVVFFLVILIFDDFGFGSKNVCSLFQFFFGRRSFLRTFMG